MLVILMQGHSRTILKDRISAGFLPEYITHAGSVYKYKFPFYADGEMTYVYESLVTWLIQGDIK